MAKIIDHIGYGDHDWWLKEIVSTIPSMYVITTGVWKADVQHFNDAIFDSWDDAIFVFDRICKNVVKTQKERYAMHTVAS